MPQSLPRKLRFVFTLQVVVAAILMVLGFGVVGSLVKERLTSERMVDEAAAWWQAYGTDRAMPLPATTSFQGWLVLADGRGSEAVPPEIHRRGPGIHLLPSEEGRPRKLYVDRRAQGTLYLVASFWLVEKIVFWTSAVSALIAIVAMAIVSLLAYRSARRLVRPVNWLAREVADWDPRHPDIGAISPERMPDGSVSEVRQLGAALRDLGGRTRAFVRRERDFTRDASHELRTPLTVIRMATDLMRDDPETPARMQRALTRVQRAGQDMEAVIDAFLILAREDDIQPPREDFDVVEVAHEVAEKGRAAVGSRPVVVEVTGEDSVLLHSSRAAFAVLLDNLVSNACTFTESGRVDVRIGKDRVTVSDTGIGMSPETLQRAYDPFFRADQFGASGKGTGLSIVRRLGERFGWPVTLESTPGVGTIATVGLAGSLRDAD